NAAFGRKKLLYQRILLVGQIALIAQAPALVAPTILLRPHAPSPRIDAHGGTESQAILPTQENSGRALREDLPLICNRHCTVALGPYFRRHLCALVLAEPAPGRRRAMREVSVVSRFRSALHERLNVVAKEPLPKR